MNTIQVKQIEKSIIALLRGDIQRIITDVRKHMVVVQEKPDGDSATVADIEIGKLLEKELVALLPSSLVVQEESFNREVYQQMDNHRYIWVVDPIDGTKAFRDPRSVEWCVGICLLEDGKPIMTFVYIPEINAGMHNGLLISANEWQDGIIVNGQKLCEPLKTHLVQHDYVSHILKDTYRNKAEEQIATLFASNLMIRAHVGHSTLVQFALVALDIKQRVFSRREASIWDVLPSAYLVQKAGGLVFYKNGVSVFPLNKTLFTLTDNHLLIPFTIASSPENKHRILQVLQ